MLFSFSFVIFFANPLVKLGVHIVALLDCIHLKIENTKNISLLWLILKQQADWSSCPKLV
jgi:hypothetical protein